MFELVYNVLHNYIMLISGYYWELALYPMPRLRVSNGENEKHVMLTPAQYLAVLGSTGFYWMSNWGEHIVLGTAESMDRWAADAPCLLEPGEAANLVLGGAALDVEMGDHSETLVRWTRDPYESCSDWDMHEYDCDCDCDEDVAARLMERYNALLQAQPKPERSRLRRGSTWCSRLPSRRSQREAAIAEGVADWEAEDEDQAALDMLDYEDR